MDEKINREISEAWMGWSALIFGMFLGGVIALIGQFIGTGFAWVFLWWDTFWFVTAFFLSYVLVLAFIWRDDYGAEEAHWT